MDSKQDKLEIRNPDAPILFVDDDPVIHRMIRIYLKNWAVEFAYSAEDALKMLETKDFVIVITDVRMPGMDGLELLREIKRTYGNRVQVIVITAYGEVDYLTRAFYGGASDFLLKPFNKEDIIAVLENALSQINRWKKAMKAVLDKESLAKKGQDG